MSYRCSAIDREALVSFAQRLVQTPSPSGQEGAVASLIAEEMHAIGFEDVRIDSLGNVLGSLGSGEGKRLLYDAHMDTVAPGERQGWPRDPFAGEIVDGALYGLGASDTKGAIAAILYAGKALLQSGIRLNGQLIVALVVQEETCEGSAIRHIIEEDGLRPDWVVLGEPTNLQIARGHRGRIEFEVTVQGRSCHAATPQRGINAIYDAARIVVGLELLAPQLNSDSFLGKGSITVTEISSVSGGRNVVPDLCTLYIDRRLTNGETEAKATAELRRVLSRESVQASIMVPEYRTKTWTGNEILVRQCFPYWATPSNEPLLLTAAAAIEDVLGFVPHIGRWEFSTDGVYTAGVAGIPTIGFGPGEERHAHTVEDQVQVADLVSAAQVYAQLAISLLGKKG